MTVKELKELLNKLEDDIEIKLYLGFLTHDIDFIAGITKNGETIKGAYITLQDENEFIPE